MKRKLVRAIFKLDDWIGLISLTVAIGIIIINVLTRGIFSRSIIWAEEISFFFFGWAVFWGASSGYKRKMHIGVDMLVRALPHKSKKIMIICVDFLLLLLNLYFTKLGFTFAISAYVKVTDILSIPYTYVDICAPLSFLMISVYSAIFLLKDFGFFSDFNFFLEEKG
jgi:TRAP-type transport system small permease protein